MQYDDKYALAEFITKSTMAAQLNVLECLGVSGFVVFDSFFFFFCKEVFFYLETCLTFRPQLQQMIEWAKTKTVTIRLKAEERCTFIRDEKRKLEDKVAHQTEVKVFGATAAKITSKTYTKIHEWFWNFQCDWALFAYVGTDVEHPLVFQGRTSACELITTTEDSPKPEVVVRPSIEFDIGWLLRHLSDGRMDFHIDRGLKTCRTPRRNDDITEAFAACGRFHDWCDSIVRYFRNTLFPVEPNHGLDLGGLHARNVFNPILPLFEEKGESVIQAGDLGPFLAEQSRSLAERRSELEATFPQPHPDKPEKDKAYAKLISIVEAQLVVTTIHGSELFEAFTAGIEYIEHMLYQQLIAAIGKIVSPTDFADYMKYHQRKLFQEKFLPRGFSYPVRRPDHYPEGTVSLEAVTPDGRLAEPVPTIARVFAAEKPMQFALDAATSVTFMGERAVHAWINQSFSGESGLRLQLAARARQFSSYILLVGRISSQTLFDPKFGIIIKDKDDVKIPLLMETIPTPKEFADAISSMSPEQQRFCKAFRSMQLESTLFGVAIIQIKPQLEKILRLPNDSLTKEIQLTQVHFFSPNPRIF